MLSEIYCDEFKSHDKIRTPIKFNKGLNIIQGQDSGENSIGKSTFLLVIDFVFGGETYAAKETIINKIGHHFINFCFTFENINYYFKRGTEQPKEVYICDENYNAIQKPISLDNFRKRLLELYKINIKDLTFRQIVGSYFRVYGKDNSNEKHPLASYSGEGQETSLTSLLKLYNSYSVLAELNKTIEDKKKLKQTLKDAGNYNLIEIITKQKIYKENKIKIQELENELKRLANKGKEELTNSNAKEIELGAELKSKYELCNRKKKQLWAKYYLIKNNLNIKKPATTEDFNELLKYFPNSNLKLLSDIENFHEKLTVILQDEFKLAITNTLKEIDETSKEMVSIEQELNSLDIPLQVSEKTLKAYAQIQNEIDRLVKSNEFYEKKKEIEKEIKELNGSYETKFIEQATPIASKINLEISKLNSYIYGENIESPLLNIMKPNSYSYKTPSDDGTGTNNKNLILLDLSMLTLTPLPAIAHDTIIFKHIAQIPMGKILELYNQFNKQIFIAIDESNKYPSEAQSIIDAKKVLNLSGNGNELYGWSWQEKEKENKNENII